MKGLNSHLVQLFHLCQCLKQTPTKFPVIRSFTLCFTIALLAYLMACDPFVPSFPNGEVLGMRPVYADATDFIIEKQSGRSIGQAGKIYSYGSVLLINERRQGIHVIDNTDPTSPVNLFFISIPGNTDMAVRDGLIYINNMSDMVVLRVETDQFEELYRIKNFFMEEQDSRYPPNHDVYFECIDPSAGVLAGWEEAILDSPDCYRK